MKLSQKPRHYAPHKRSGISNKNYPGGRSRWGARHTRSLGAILGSIFRGMSRRTRRVFLQKERVDQKASGMRAGA